MDFIAQLNPSGPNYIYWRRIFLSDNIPLLFALPTKGQKDETEDLYYCIDLGRMGAQEHENLVQDLMGLNMTREAALYVLELRGSHPIPRDDVIVKVFPEDFSDDKKPDAAGDA